jgi:superfamily II DNA or RNA helicase
MFITRRGYQIKKSLLTEDKINKIKENLNVTPEVSKDFADNIQSFSIFHETPRNIFVPRYYGIKNFGEQKFIDFNSKKCYFKFNGNLKENQINVFNQIFPLLIKNKGGIITLPCGYGKTILALYIASKINLKTMILVHKTFLQDQWIERIKEFIPESKIGFIRQNNINVENKDFIVGMIQSISQRQYDKEIFNDIGLIIIDECHHIASRVFSKALYKVNAEYLIGLSATPNRKDGLTKIIKWYLGNTLCNITSQVNNSTIVYKYNFNCNDLLFQEKQQYMKGKMILAIPKMTTNISKISCRNNLIINTIFEISKHENRKILILSGRIAHLEYLKEQVDKLLNDTKSNIKTNYYIGKSTKDDRKDAEVNGDILFASYSMAHEGLDIPRLNTIILATPQKDVVQAIGRIMRKTQINCVVNPLIIDLCDELSIFNFYSEARTKLYLSNDYKITNFYINNDLIKCNYDKNNIDLNIIYEDIKDLSIHEVKKVKFENNKITKCLFDENDLI